VRIGIDNNPSMPLDQYVLGQLTQDQMIVLHNTIQQTKDLIEMYVSGIPFVDIMTKYNTQT
jgi:peptidyl-tRNA hydrolase